MYIDTAVSTDFQYTQEEYIKSIIGLLDEKDEIIKQKEAEIYVNKLSCSQKIAEIQKNFLIQREIQAKQIDELKFMYSSSENERKTLLQELKENQSICKLAHDKIVDLISINAEIKTKLEDAINRNKQYEKQVTDLNWILKLNLNVNLKSI